jgi:hypothetical protein
MNYLLLLLPLLAPYALWILFLADMALSRAEKDGHLHHHAAKLGRPVQYLALLLNVLLNFTLVPLVMLDWPREFTVSAHLSRLIATGNRYQRWLSGWICTVMLDCFDPSGTHCWGREQK